MPITIQQPIVGAPFGPGYLIELSSSFTGPISNPVWSIGLYDTDLVVQHQSMVVSLTTAPYAISLPFLDNGQVQYRKGATQIGANARLHTVLAGDAGGVEVDDRLVIFDPTSGVLPAIKNDIAVVRGDVLNLPSNTSINAMSAKVTASFPGLAGIGLGELFRLAGGIFHPPIGFIHRELIGDFSSPVSLDRPAPGVGVNAFGVAWEVISYGGGVGLDPGAPQTFDLPIMMLDTEYTDSASHDFVADTFVATFSNHYWFFEPAFPTRLNVYPTPSFTVRLYWLLAP